MLQRKNTGYKITKMHYPIVSHNFASVHKRLICHNSTKYLRQNAVTEKPLKNCWLSNSHGTNAAYCFSEHAK